MKTQITHAAPAGFSRKAGLFWSRIVKSRYLYVMVTPGLLYFALFKYLPMWGVMIAFKDYLPFRGFWNSPWVGFKHFDRFFHDPVFWLLFKNTFILAVYNIVFFFPIPILIALMLNELRLEWFKRTIQTAIYIPHFVSWVVVVGMVYTFFSSEGGIFTNMMVNAGMDKINFLMSNDWFRPMIILEVIWKESGWGTIIFLAALSGVDPTLYEAAKMDGAGRFKQLWHITLPAIRSTIVILFILRLGNFLDSGFEQIFLMLNSTNREVGEVFDTYVYSNGVQQGQFSFSTAVGLFKSLVGLCLVLAANKLAKKMGEQGVY
ncbi:MAG: yteP4 [Paenibacillus sp.]|nr:yteP4 [Paenibacillus sp.]